MKLVCAFKIGNSTQRIPLGDTSVDIYKGGFWVDNDFKLAVSSPKRYFIPAGQILYFEKDYGKPTT